MAERFLAGNAVSAKSDTYEISEKERTLLRKAIGNLDWYVSGLGIYAAEEITEASRTGRARRHLIVIFPISEADLESGVFLKTESSVFPCGTAPPTSC